MGVLTAAQKLYMARAGFILREINHFDTARTIDGSKRWNLDFNNQAFQDMIRHRRIWVATLRRNGWSGQQIGAQIKSFYVGHASHRDAFDLLAIETSPSARYKKATDTDIAVKLLSRTRISKAYGKAYGRKMNPVLVPRYIPKPPRLPNM